METTLKNYLDKYNLTIEIVEKALKFMQSEGYMESTDTPEDLIENTRCMVQNINFMVTAKINQWANS